MSPETKFKIGSYLKLFQLRASGVLKTPATWIRSFVMSHGKYNHDSKINEEINYDLLMKIHQMSLQNVSFDSEGKKIVLEKFN
jgi:glutamate--cysteine ligase catalytic subunit